jgi:hypothetical protein
MLKMSRRGLFLARYRGELRKLLDFEISVCEGGKELKNLKL